MRRILKRWIVAPALAGVALAAGAQWVTGQVQQGKNQCWREPDDSPYACSVCGQSCLGTGYRCCTVLADPIPNPTL